MASAARPFLAPRPSLLAPFPLLFLLLASLLPAVSRAAIVPQALQIQAEEAIVLRIASVERISALNRPAPPETDREIVVVRGTVEATLWSRRSGLLTGDAVLLKIPLDPRETARRIKHRRRDSLPGPQVLHTSAPRHLLQPADATGPVLIRAFIKKSSRDELRRACAAWGRLPTLAESEISRDPVFFAPAAHQYSLQRFFFFGNEWPGLHARLLSVDQEARVFDTVITYASVPSTAFTDAPQAGPGRPVELPPGTTLEWLGPVSAENSPDHWAYDSASGKLYRLHPRNGLAALPAWVMHTCKLSDPTLRAAAEAFARAEKTATQPARHFAALLRLKHLHTRLETLTTRHEAPPAHRQAPRPAPL